MYTLEHRYYGWSQPFTDAEGGWSYENLKWLNVSQAIEDIEMFTQYLKGWHAGDKTKIVLVGGSYPGAVVAWFKAVHPTSVAAVWSSSGVIMAEE